MERERENEDKNNSKMDLIRKLKKCAAESTKFTNHVKDAFDLIGLPKIPNRSAWMTWNIGNYNMDKCRSAGFL